MAPCPFSIAETVSTILSNRQTDLSLPLKAATFPLAAAREAL